MAIRVALSIVLMTALAAWLGYDAVSAMRSGVANARGILYPRTKHPMMFWLIVTVQIGFTILCFYVLLRQMRV